MPHVVVIGGGVGGLSAAHELVDRGFTVDVYEARPDFGGKARSQPHGAAPPGRKALPGEHGFRFYPRFYKHIINTMSKIPDGAGFVVDHLQATSEAALALIDNKTWYRFDRKQVGTPWSLIETIELFFQELDFDAEDISVYVAKLLEYATSSDERREGEYEHISWWEYLDASAYSEGFAKSQRGIPRMMVAMDPIVGSARTIGTISMQLFADFGATGGHTDRTMGGPTTQMWIDPWIAYLTTKGVGLHLNEKCTGLSVAGGQISGVTFSGAGTVTADYYVLAVPLETAMELITPDMGVIDPALEKLRNENVDDLASWMVGIQFFLYEDVPMVRGHLFFPDSPWALTAISQPQFWRKLGLFRKTYGDGSVGGCISVDVSDWNTPGKLIPKTAKMCTPDEIAQEVWYQIKMAVNGAGEGSTYLTDDLLHSYHLDTDLDYSGGLPPKNSSRLLVHPPGSWDVRPEAGTRIPNLVLASDYVKTHTNLATMEGANEAARRAVNAILERSGSTAGKSEIWPLVESGSILIAMKAIDRALYKMGQKHLFQILGIKKGARAAAWLRRISKLSGLDAVDNYLDARIRPTRIVKGLLAKVGIHLP